MSTWHHNRYAPLSDWYHGQSQKDVRQDRKMASLEKKLDALLKTSSSAKSDRKRAHPGPCLEASTPDTVWVCSSCNCPHNNIRKVVCRWCGQKRTEGVHASQKDPKNSAAASTSVSASASWPSILVPSLTPGPIDKPWMKRVLAASSTSADSGSADSGLSRSAGTAGLEAATGKRAQLENMLAIAKSSGLAEELIKHIQADLDALPVPQNNSQLQEAGRLYQEKAKQEKHFASQMASLDVQFENIRKQREHLDTLEKQLVVTRQELEAQHAGNMERIDAAINVRVSPHTPITSSGAETLRLDPVSQATTAQVLSATLGTAVNDTSFLSNVPPEHHAAIKNFCAQVTSHFAIGQSSAAPTLGTSTSHFASSLPSSGATTISAPMPSTSSLGADIEMSDDGGDRPFVGISG